VLLLWLALWLNYVDRQMVFSIFPALKAELGFSDPQLGLVGSVFTSIYAVLMPVAGRWADRFRRDRMIVSSMALWSAATLGCGLSNSVSVFLFWRAVMGITEAMYYPAAVVLLAESHADQARSKALGIHQSAQLAGIVAGGWYGGWMADHVSWRAGFAVAAVTGIMYAALLTRLLPESQPAGGQAPENPFRTAAALFRRPSYVMLSVAFFAFCSMLWIFYAWLPAYLYERFQLSMTSSGFRATMFVQASCGVGVVAGGVLADRLVRRVAAARFYIAAAGILLSAPLGYMTFAVDSLAEATVCSAAYGAFSGLMVGNVFAASYDVAAGRSFGLAAGVLNMIGGLAASIMIFLAGLWKDTLGFAGLLQWVAAGCVLAAVLLCLAAQAHFARDARAAGCGAQ
jgi:MFS family permease